MAKSSDLASLVVTLELQSARYQQGFDQATARLNRFHKETSDSLHKIADLFAGALSADAVLSFAESTIKASADLEQFSKASGIAVEQLSALQFAAKAGGVDTEGLTTALKKLNVSISDAAGNAESKAATAFGLLGINVRDAAGHTKDANQIFTEVADKFAATQDGANKVALAVALFGKAGEELIPTLDKGSAGLKTLADQAAAAGAIIDGPTAAAAEAFRLKIDLLKTSLVDGIGTQVEKRLLPVLNSLADEFLGTAKSAENMAVIVDEVTAGFKVLISGGLLVKEVFSQIGDAIGGAVAAIGAVLEGDFKRAGAILDDQSAHAKKSAEDTAASLVDVWQANAPKFNKAVDETVTKAKASLGSLAGAEAAQAALKQLQALATQLGEEATRTDAGTLAATKYKLAHGELAKALAITGQKGRDAEQSILGFAKQIDLDHVTKGVAELKSQLAALSGDTAGAALEHFDTSTKHLRDTLASVGGEAQKSGDAVIGALRQATVYQNAFNVLQTNAARINADAAEAEQKVTDAQANGSITSIQAEEQLQAIRAKTISQLQGIKNGEDSIAAAANNPALTQGAKQFSAQLDHLKAQSDAMTTQIRGDFESAFGDNFAKLITGAESFKQAIHGFLNDIFNDLAKIASKNIAESLFSGSGSGSGLVSTIAGLFSGGAHADGGIIPSGTIGLVGERGPELVMGAPGGTNVIPNGQGVGGDIHVTNHFVIQSQNGMISKQSQSQVAAAAARSLGQVNARRLA